MFLVLHHWPAKGVRSNPSPAPPSPPPPSTHLLFHSCIFSGFGANNCKPFASWLNHVTLHWIICVHFQPLVSQSNHWHYIELFTYALTHLSLNQIVDITLNYLRKVNHFTLHSFFFIRIYFIRISRLKFAKF